MGRDRDGGLRSQVTALRAVPGQEHVQSVASVLIPILPLIPSVRGTGVCSGTLFLLLQMWATECSC